MKILVADDELRLRKVVALFLKKNGHEVFEASNGEQVMTAIKEHKPDVIILDVVMHGENGYDVCKRIKANEEYRSIPVMILTANASYEDKILSEEAGASAYMTKPFSPKELLEKIISLKS